MPFEYREDIPGADAAFHAWAPDLPELFASAWGAVRGILIDCDNGCPEHGGGRQAEGPQRSFQLSGRDLDLLLLDFLQEQLYYKDAEGVLYELRALAIEQRGTGWALEVQMVGQPIERFGECLGVDVKAVTLDHLGVTQSNEGWSETVVLDL